MSFDVNIGRSEPVIKAAANMNNDGGSSGNTGYMSGGRRQKKEEKGSLFSNISVDSFELSSKTEFKTIPPQENSWIDKLFGKRK